MDDNQPTFRMVALHQRREDDYGVEKEFPVDILTVYAHGPLEIKVGEWKYIHREDRPGFWCREVSFTDRANRRKIEINQFSSGEERPDADQEAA